jgi:hypothetical protein
MVRQQRLLSPTLRPGSHSTSISYTFAPTSSSSSSPIDLRLGNDARLRLVDLTTSSGHPTVTHELLGRDSQVGVLLEAGEEKIFDDLWDGSEGGKGGEVG